MDERYKDVRDRGAVWEYGPSNAADASSSVNPSGGEFIWLDSCSLLWGVELHHKALFGEQLVL